MTGAVLETASLSAGYDGLTAVRDVSLSVQPGEVVALMGPNGAGKTTTLLVIAGELERTSGEVFLFGAPARGRLHVRARAGLGYLAEGRSILRQLTVEENISLCSGSLDDALAVAPELERLLQRKAGLLSGGEQQMLALAMALGSKRLSLLLTDELSLGLSPLMAARMLRTVRAAADKGVGALVVEQQAERALEVCDRGYVMRHGMVEVAGTADELRSRRRDISDAYFAL